MIIFYFSDSHVIKLYRVGCHINYILVFGLSRAGIHSIKFYLLYCHSTKFYLCLLFPNTFFKIFFGLIWLKSNSQTNARLKPTFHIKSLHKILSFRLTPFLYLPEIYLSESHVTRFNLSDCRKVTLMIPRCQITILLCQRMSGLCYQLVRRTKLQFQRLLTC